QISSLAVAASGPTSAVSPLRPALPPLLVQSSARVGGASDRAAHAGRATARAGNIHRMMELLSSGSLKGRLSQAGVGTSRGRATGLRFRATKQKAPGRMPGPSEEIAL